MTTKEYKPRVKITYHRKQQGTVNNSDNTTVTYVTLDNYRTGSSNPNWKKKIQDGNDAATPFVGQRQTFTVQPPYYHGQWIHGNAVDTFSELSEGNFNGVDLPVVDPNRYTIESWPSNSEAHSRALKALYKKIKEVHSQFAGGVFLAELRKTVKMIRTPAMELRKQMGNYLSKQHKQAAKIRGNSNAAKKAIAGTYLEATFGWQPLISDVKDGAIALARLMHDVQHERFRAFGQTETLNNQSAVVKQGFDIPVYNQKTVDKYIQIVTFYGSFQGHAADSRLDATIGRAVELSGFQLRDFVPTVWELIPYSFVADYFVNIGDILEAAFTDTSIVRRVTKVEIVEWRRETHVSPNYDMSAKEIKLRYGNVKGLSQEGRPGKFELVTRIVRRTPLSGVPFPAPRFEPPELFSKHSLNLAALLAGSRLTNL